MIAERKIAVSIIANLAVDPMFTFQPLSLLFIRKLDARFVLLARSRRLVGKFFVEDDGFSIVAALALAYCLLCSVCESCYFGLSILAQEKSHAKMP